MFSLKASTESDIQVLLAGVMKSMIFYLIFSLSAFGFQEDYAPPQIIRNAEQSFDMWVSLSLISWENGEPIAKNSGKPLGSIIDNYNVESIQLLKNVQEKRLKKENASPCFENTIHVPLADSFLDVLNKSKFIFSALVQHVEPGFFQGSPAELATLEIQKPVRFPGDKMAVYRSHTENFYLVKWPTSFYLDNVPICKVDPRYIFNGDNLTGKRLLIFSPNSGGDEYGSIVYTGFQFIFGETEKGDLVIPPGLIGDPDLSGIKTFEELIDFVDSLPPVRTVIEALGDEKKK